MTQARRLGAEILSAQEACAIRLQDPYRFVRLGDGSEISCHAVLLATGADFNLLDLPRADNLAGAGIYYGAAYTEALFHKDQHVYVVGGANSAAQGALYLSRFASRVTVLMRGDAPTASFYLVEAMRKNDKIEICVNTDLVDLHGQERLEGLVIRNRLNGETQPRPCQALFVFIGVKPQSDLVAGLVERNEKGYILTGPDLRANNRRPTKWSHDRDPYLLETSVPGIFAAGDVRLGTSQRVASAAGEGGVAAALVRQYLNSL
jgi:thioredoxin reductase (NADPH)